MHRCYSSSVDRALEDLLHTLIDSDPHAVLDDQQRERITYALLGMLSREKLEAVWKFTDSISDEVKRSYLLHQLIKKFPATDFRLAKHIADAIHIPYWRCSSFIDIASGILKMPKRSPQHATTFGTRRSI